jgi:hypothetical protein
MDSISSINSLLSPELISSAIPVPQVRHASMAPVEAVAVEDEADFSSYDFSNYAPDVEEYADPVVRAGENVIQSAQALDNAMVAALENGFSVQDACNIKMAQIAYKASCAVFKTTFEIKI